MQNLIGSNANDVLILGPDGGAVDGQDGNDVIATSGKSDAVRLGSGANTVQVHPLQKTATVDGFDS